MDEERAAEIFEDLDIVVRLIGKLLLLKTVTVAKVDQNRRWK